MKKTLSALLLLWCFLLCACAKPLSEGESAGPEEQPRQAAVFTVLKNGGEEYLAELSLSLSREGGEPLASRLVTLSLEGETQEVQAQTDETGVVRFSCGTLKAGNYVYSVAFGGDAQSAPVTSEGTLAVRARENRSGVYVLGKEMARVEFEALRENGIGHIFLRQDALQVAGREGTEAFLAKAAEYGIKTHLWFICLWDNGGLVNPLDPLTGELNRAYFDTEVEKVREYCSLRGLYGAHFDYIRYDGSKESGERADKYVFGTVSGADAVSAFVREVCAAAKSANGDLVLSGALMPFFEELEGRFGQDVAALSEVLDFFVPMTYTGNCEEDAAWLAETISDFCEATPQTEIWAGLLSYESDDHPVTLPPETVQSEVRAAYRGGAAGCVVFLYGAWADGTDIFALCPLEPDSTTLA